MLSGSGNAEAEYGGLGGDGMELLGFREAASGGERCGVVGKGWGFTSFLSLVLRMDSKVESTSLRQTDKACLPASTPAC